MTLEEARAASGDIIRRITQRHLSNVTREKETNLRRRTITETATGRIRSNTDYNVTIVTQVYARDENSAELESALIINFKETTICKIALSDTSPSDTVAIYDATQQTLVYNAM